MTVKAVNELKAKPGEYIWDSQQTKFIGRINKDGTEDKRFSNGGLCSLLNNIIEKTGFIPNNPQVFAGRIANHRRTQYLVKGYGVIVSCYDLSAEMWLAKAAEHLGIEGDGIADILKHVSTSKATEHKAKIESLALIFGKELKSKKLADLTVVTEFEERLTEERKNLAQEKAKTQKVQKLKTWIEKAFQDPLILVKTFLPVFETRSYKGQGDAWVLCNVTLRWCLQNRGMKSSVESRFHSESESLFAELNATDLQDYALQYAQASWSLTALNALDVIENFHHGLVSEKDYENAKQDIYKLR